MRPVLPLRHRPARRRATVPALLAALVGGALVATVPGMGAGAQADDAPPRDPNAQPIASYEMPFPCGVQWRGTTRQGHSPSVYAIDFNRADDLGAPTVAAAAGKVTSVQTVDRGVSYGRYVILDHGNGESTVYAHLDTVTVAAGDVVAQGQQVGTVGASGKVSGAHLHFEERLDRQVIKPWFHGSRYKFDTTSASQNCQKVPLADNMEGSKAAETVVYVKETKAVFQVSRPGGGVRDLALGNTTTAPVLGDWDGNGVSNPGVRYQASSTFRLRTPKGYTTLVFGAPADRPVAGDWDGDGRWEVGVRQAGTKRFLLRMADGTERGVTLGNAGDVPVTGDWNGDGVTDLGVYDPSAARFTLRFVDGSGIAYKGEVSYGKPGDQPVTGDWDGNGTTDLGVYRPSSGEFVQRQAPSATASQTGEKRVAPRG